MSGHKDSLLQQVVEDYAGQLVNQEALDLR
jgi:hypothetical protein